MLYDMFMCLKQDSIWRLAKCLHFICWRHNTKCHYISKVFFAFCKANDGHVLVIPWPKDDHRYMYDRSSALHLSIQMATFVLSCSAVSFPVYDLCHCPVNDMDCAWQHSWWLQIDLLSDGCVTPNSGLNFLALHLHLFSVFLLPSSDIPACFSYVWTVSVEGRNKEHRKKVEMQSKNVQIRVGHKASLTEVQKSVITNQSVKKIVTDWAGAKIIYCARHRRTRQVNYFCVNDHFGHVHRICLFIECVDCLCINWLEGTVKVMFIHKKDKMHNLLLFISAVTQSPHVLQFTNKCVVKPSNDVVMRIDR